MQTDCTPGQVEFHGFGRRSVVGAFDEGRQTSDAGVLLLREVAERTGLIRRFAACFTDHRRPERIEHTVESGISWESAGAGRRTAATPWQARVRSTAWS